MPTTDVCWVCGDPVRPDAVHVAVWDEDLGEWRCSRCHANV